MVTHRATLSKDFASGLVQLKGKFFHVEELVTRARTIQHKALTAKAAGNMPYAVALYRELIPYLDKIDELDMLQLPRGLQTQIAKRTIEQLEEHTAQSA